MYRELTGRASTRLDPEDFVFMVLPLFFWDISPQAPSSHSHSPSFAVLSELPPSSAPHALVRTTSIAIGAPHFACPSSPTNGNTSSSDQSPSAVGSRPESAQDGTCADVLRLGSISESVQAGQ